MSITGGRYGKAKKDERPGNESDGSGITYNEIIAFAVGVIGMRRDDVDWMTPAEYNECVNAWHKQRAIDEQKAYEISRFQGWVSLLPHLKNQSPVDVVRFDWEPVKMAKIINGKTNSISKTKPPARRGEQKAKG